MFERLMGFSRNVFDRTRGALGLLDVTVSLYRATRCSLSSPGCLSLRTLGRQLLCYEDVNRAFHVTINTSNARLWRRLYSTQYGIYINPITPASRGKPQVGALHGLGLVRSKDGVTAPVLHGANAARQKLLDVDLAAFDKVVSVRGTARKRREVSGGVAGDGPEGEDHDDVDDGHAGGRGNVH